MKHYKFQALVTPYAANGGPPCPALDAAPRRMLLHGRSDHSGRGQFFSVLVSRDGDMPFPSGNPRLEVVLRIAGDDVAEYLGIGRHFTLWLGEDVAEGIVTRRLFV
jgi:hypothetical protein